MPVAGISPGTTLAILLGASTWPRSPQLAASPSFARSAREFREYLLAEDGFGLPAENLLDLFDSDKSPSELDAEVGRFLEQRGAELGRIGAAATDLVVYYVGHGGFTGKGHDYYLAVRATRKDSEGISSLRISDLADTLQKRARRVRRYVILDSCFAASAYTEFQAAPLAAAREKTLEAFPGKGTALLCSSGARDPSLAPAGAAHTMFSGALLDVLHRGEPGGPDAFSIEDVGQRVKELIAERYPDEHVRPEVHSPDQREGDVADIPLFPNPAVRARRLAEQIADLGRRLEALEGSGLPDLPGRVSRVEAAVAEAGSAVEVARGLGGRVASLEAALGDLRAQEAAGRATTPGHGPPETAGSEGYFGLSARTWSEIPPDVRRDLHGWRQARWCGWVWLAATLVVCGLGLLTHYARHRPVFATEGSNELAASLAMPVYLLVLMVALGSMLAFVLRPLVRPQVERAQVVPPGPVEEWWERLDPVVAMRATRIAPLLGRLRIASPWAEIAAVIGAAVSLVLTVLKYGE